MPVFVEQQNGNVGFGQGAFPPGSRWSWANDGKAPDGGNAERIFAPGVAREVLSFYVLDGMATGSTMHAAVLALRATGAGRVVIAVPTASHQARALLRLETFFRDCQSIRPGDRKQREFVVSRFRGQRSPLQAGFGVSGSDFGPSDHGAR